MNYTHIPQGWSHLQRLEEVGMVKVVPAPNWLDTKYSVIAEIVINNNTKRNSIKKHIDFDRRGNSVKKYLFERSPGWKIDELALIEWMIGVRQSVKIDKDFESKEVVPPKEYLLSTAIKTKMEAENIFN